MPAKRGPITEADYSVEDRGYETPCWIWNGPLTTQGYPRFGRGETAHVLVYRDAHGRPAPGHIVHHLCEQKTCIREGHLEAIPRQEHPKRHLKVTPEMRMEIRRATGTTRQIARRYGISKSHVALLRSSGS